MAPAMRFGGKRGVSNAAALTRNTPSRSKPPRPETTFIDAQVEASLANEAEHLKDAKAIEHAAISSGASARSASSITSPNSSVPRALLISALDDATAWRRRAEAAEQMLAQFASVQSLKPSMTAEVKGDDELKAPSELALSARVFGGGLLGIAASARESTTVSFSTAEAQRPLVYAPTPTKTCFRTCRSPSCSHGVRALQERLTEKHCPKIASLEAAQELEVEETSKQVVALVAETSKQVVALRARLNQGHMLSEDEITLLEEAAGDGHITLEEPNVTTPAVVTAAATTGLEVAATAAITAAATATAPASAASSAPPIIEQLREALVSNLARVLDLFRGLDHDGSGLISKSEFRTAIPSLGLGVDVQTADSLFEALDGNKSGSVEYAELKRLLRRRAGDSAGDDRVRMKPALPRKDQEKAAAMRPPPRAPLSPSRPKPATADIAATATKMTAALPPATQDMSDKPAVFYNLQTRFPLMTDEQILAALKRANNHAGCAAKELKNLTKVALPTGD